MKPMTKYLLASKVSGNRHSLGIQKQKDKKFAKAGILEYRSKPVCTSTYAKTIVSVRPVPSCRKPMSTSRPVGKLAKSLSLAMRVLGA